MNFSDDFKIGSKTELIDLIDEVGFVPFFTNEIEGFSIEEHIESGCWCMGMEGACNKRNERRLWQVP